MTPSPSIFTPEKSQVAERGSCILPAVPCVSNQSKPQRHVSQIRQAESELDRLIAELGKKAEQAMNEGQPEQSREWSERMYAAIASRGPEHVERLEREALQRLDDNCFTGKWALRLARSTGGTVG